MRSPASVDLVADPPVERLATPSRKAGGQLADQSGCRVGPRLVDVSRAPA